MMFRKYSKPREIEVCSPSSCSKMVETALVGAGGWRPEQRSNLNSLVSHSEGIFSMTHGAVCFGLISDSRPINMRIPLKHFGSSVSLLLESNSMLKSDLQGLFFPVFSRASDPACRRLRFRPRGRQVILRIDPPVGEW